MSNSTFWKTNVLIGEHVIEFLYKYFFESLKEI